MKRQTKRIGLAGLLAISAVGLFGTQVASAEEHWGGGYGYGYYSPRAEHERHEWREHERHEWREHERREWREHEWREHHRGGYYYQPYGHGYYSSPYDNGYYSRPYGNGSYNGYYYGTFGYGR